MGREGFEGMRKAGRLAAEILDALVPHVVPGVTTGELDDLAREHMLREAARFPATLGYRGYHQELLHLDPTTSSATAFPGRERSKDGDIVNYRTSRLSSPRLARRHEPHVPGRRRAAEGAQAWSTS